MESVEKDLARCVLSLASVGGMPDTFWMSDSRIALACSVLDIPVATARLIGGQLVEDQWKPRAAEDAVVSAAVRQLMRDHDAAEAVQLAAEHIREAVSGAPLGLLDDRPAPRFTGAGPSRLVPFDNSSIVIPSPRCPKCDGTSFATMLTDDGEPDYLKCSALGCGGMVPLP